MTTSKSDYSLKPRCICPPRVEGPNADTEENRVTSIMLSARISLVVPELSPTEVLGPPHGCGRSFESLKHALSSRGGRELLYALPIEQAIEAIDVLEQGSREDSPLCAHHRKRFSVVLKKMCLKHRQLPPSYALTDELRRIGVRAFGRGGYADVWRGVYRGSRVAIKVLRVDSRNSDGMEKEFCREVVLCKQFKHPNLLQLLGAKTSPTLMIISEWMEHGTIMDFVVACPETNRLKLLADVARGLKYLHEWPSVHADLKSSNVLIDSDHTARIADFGLTSLLCNPSISISMTAPAWGGTHQWMAPELFDGKSRPSRESDVYALGMVIYEVFAHESPFSHVFPYAVHVLVLAGERPLRPTNRDILGLSEDVWMLVEKCWDRVPSARPHTADILVLLETASRGWVSPTSEAITGLGLGRPASKNHSTPESADTMSEIVFGTFWDVV